MRPLHIALAALLIGFGAMGTVSADEISADILSYDGVTKTATAKGNVVVRNDEGAVMTGAEGEYHFDDRSAYLTGGVHYVKGAQTMDAATVNVYGDRTLVGTGSVVIYDGEEGRTLRGDTVVYNPDTGYSKVDGNGFIAMSEGSLTAPYIEGNTKEIRLTAYGGVNFQSDVHNLYGYGDQAVYTKSPYADDGRVVLTGNAEATQNGNHFEGPELVFSMKENTVETNGRSTLVITNTSGK